MAAFVSRAGQKLDHAISVFSVDVKEKTCADLGCNTGGFVDCLLQRGASKIFAIDTGYGVLDYKLRKDPRVVVMERTNAMHATLPQPVDIVTIDVAWTKQKHILPAAKKLLAKDGVIITLIKPHYEANATLLRQGILPEEAVDGVVEAVKREVSQHGLIWINTTPSPIKGTGGNVEVFALLRPGESEK